MDTSVRACVEESVRRCGTLENDVRVKRSRATTPSERRSRLPIRDPTLHQKTVVPSDTSCAPPPPVTVFILNGDTALRWGWNLFHDAFVP